MNKVNTKVILYWNPALTTACSQAVIERFKQRYGGFILDDGMVQIVGQKHRTQKQNQDDCIEKLEAMLNDVLIPPKKRRATKPSKSAVRKRLDSKRKDSDKKQLRRKDY